MLLVRLRGMPKRYFCSHCNEYVAKSTFFAHKQLAQKQLVNDSDDDESDDPAANNYSLQSDRSSHSTDEDMVVEQGMCKLKLNYG